MPCKGPDDYECRQESAVSAVAKHIVYLYTELGKPEMIPAYVNKAAESAWSHMSKFDDMTAMLCEALQSESVHDTHAIVYNGRKKKSRALADWWEEHQELDAQRELKLKQQQDEADEAELAAILKSLTSHQRKLLKRLNS